MHHVHRKQNKTARAKENVLKPLEMTATSFYLTPELKATGTPDL